jgi:hypothetical protein
VACENRTEAQTQGPATGGGAKQLHGARPEQGAATAGSDEAENDNEPLSQPVESGAEGKPQLVIPGAERISDAELAKRRSEQPLKPKAEQKPARRGLFSEGHKQTDLVDQARGFS